MQVRRPFSSFVTAATVEHPPLTAPTNVVLLSLSSPSHRRYLQTSEDDLGAISELTIDLDLSISNSPSMASREHSDDEVIIALRSRCTSPEVLATFSFGGGVKNIHTKPATTINNSGKVTNSTIGDRLHALHGANSEKREAKVLLQNSKQESELLHATFTPSINKRYPINDDGPDRPSVFERLGVLEPKERRCQQQMTSRLQKVVDHSFSPSINTRSQQMRQRGKYYYEEQVAWKSKVDRKAHQIRFEDERQSRSHTPTINATSAKIAKASEDSGITVEQRLIAFGASKAARLQTLTHEVNAEQIGELHHRTVSAATFEKLYDEADERRRQRIEEDRQALYEQLDAEGQRLFHPVLNPRSMAICSQAVACGVSKDFTHYQHPVPAADYPHSKVAVSEVSERLAAQKLQREGLSHVPVHERLAHHQVAQPLVETRYTFTPTINTRSVALDKANSIDGASRIERLLNAQQTHDTRVANLRSERAAAEEAKLHLVKRTGDSRTTITKVKSDTFDDRQRTWALRRDSRVAHQRQQLQHEAVAECTFTPRLAR